MWGNTRRSRIYGRRSVKRRIAISAEEFTDIATEYDMTVTDILEELQKDEQNEMMEEGLSAEDENGLIIEFYVYVHKDNATVAFDRTMNAIDKTNGSGGRFVKTININNYGLYVLTVGNETSYLCRIDNTMIYVKVPKSERENIESFLTALGYL